MSGSGSPSLRRLLALALVAVGVLGFLVAPSGNRVAAAALTFAPVADASVMELQPAATFGAANLLSVDAGSGNIR